MAVRQPQERVRRSTLVVPADQPRLLAGAGRFGADQVLLDLAGTEPAQKDTARAAVIDALETTDYGDALIGLRINAIDDMWAYRDVVDVVERVGDFVDGIVIPRVSAPGDVEFVANLVRMIEQRIDLGHGIGIEAEIGSALGLSLLDEIALATDRLEAVVLDEAGVGSVLGARRDAFEAGAHAIRVRVLVTARAAGLDAIVAPDVAGDKPDAYRTAITQAVALGFDGARCAHPTQVDDANRTFATT